MKLLEENQAMPLYKKIYFSLKEKIFEGELKPNEQLPTENYLCKKFNVSRITIRKALKLLTNEHLISTVQGKGSYVIPHKMTGQLNKVQGFSEFAISKEKKRKQIILKRELLNNETIAKRLFLPIDSDLVYIKRIFAIDQIPIAIDQAWLSAKKFPDLITNINEDNFLYDYLEKNYHIYPQDSYREINAILPTSEEKNLLKITNTVPLFEVAKTVYNQFEQPFEFSNYVVRGDKMTYTIDSTASQFHFNNEKSISPRTIIQD